MKIQNAVALIVLLLCSGFILLITMKGGTLLEQAANIIAVVMMTAFGFIVGMEVSELQQDKKY